ncbi:MAG: alpha-amylase/4-alpha-glucanotransferase domain-containing protein [Pseudomonadota bacterium]
MSKTVNLLLGIHHHQPVGNFGQVFSEAFQKCYWPFLNILEKYPAIKISLHHSGPLLDWALAHENDYLPTLVRLVTRGQIEIMGGGYYEPILPILKTTDALGQIQMMQKFWQKQAQVTPKGMWLAERVWEPSLASVIYDAGLAYTILDDEHFRHAGLTDPTLLNYYLTERAGKTVAIFPSDQRLRYLIPFKPVEEVVGHLLSLAEAAPNVGITYGDDGEKFGVWPGTHEWVIKKGWLENFFSALTDNQDRIKTTTFSEFMAERPPEKTIYLPTASYREMLEWAMPADAIFRFQQAQEILKKSGMWELAAPFLRGGFFDNFLSKYPESNLMHKKMLYVSNRLDEAEAKGHKLPAARQALYQGQCNCAYWHGLFGGLYLSHLRHGIYENLIKAENIIDAYLRPEQNYLDVELTDLNFDHTDEIIIRTPVMQAMIFPNNGGSISELSYRPANFNVQNTLARRFEAYHHPADAQKKSEQGNGNIPSIHEIKKDIQKIGELIYDKYPSFSLIDHIFPADLDWKEVQKNLQEPLADFGKKKFQIVNHKNLGKKAEIILKAQSNLDHEQAVYLTKEFNIVAPNSMVVNYLLEFEKQEQPNFVFATELNMSLLAGHNEQRYYQWKNMEPNSKKVMLDANKKLNDLTDLNLIDEAFGFKVALNAEPACFCTFWPIETVSQSEKGFDHLYQGSKIILSWSNLTKFSVGISLEKL